MNKIYITTSIPYVNAAPHVGFALELVQADAYARHFRLLGHDVRFQCGTDDNSLKNVRSAEAAGLEVRDFVNANADRFERLGGLLDISNEEFVRTSRDPRHIACVHALWRACAENGDLYRKAYEGLYCVGCEQFYEPSELDDGRCPEHGIALETIREENWFFSLSRYGDRLRELVETGGLRIVPAHRRNEVLALLRHGLSDISVSRSAERARGWGVPVPDGDEVVYVWFDALANYLTGLSHGSDPTLLQHYWNGGQRIHVVGKGISKFHAIYWPAILLSAGLPPPSSILVHGYVTVAGRSASRPATASIRNASSNPTKRPTHCDITCSGIYARVTMAISQTSVWKPPGRESWQGSSEISPTGSLPFCRPRSTASFRQCQTASLWRRLPAFRRRWLEPSLPTSSMSASRIFSSSSVRRTGGLHNARHGPMRKPCLPISRRAIGRRPLLVLALPWPSRSTALRSSPAASCRSCQARPQSCIPGSEYRLLASIGTP
ncbi:hypothetical protein GGE50_003612 [Rhizobium leguminosarum]|nr:hypothetical protein [Rhizobium leguminosarum]MDH6659807.1 hypothetical protein [Rhizobium sophorae]MBB4344588.1 hypothetical protein [Rhizobium leguminosarum]MBB4354703.1 hypothetical protein [Rhizobium leguminosarum]MBB4387077.1 hypothetical protein [Rhizobium leguminosarum]